MIVEIVSVMLECHHVCLLARHQILTLTKCLCRVKSINVPLIARVAKDLPILLLLKQLPLQLAYLHLQVCYPLPPLTTGLLSLFSLLLTALQLHLKPLLHLNESFDGLVHLFDLVLSLLEFL